MLLFLTACVSASPCVGQETDEETGLHVLSEERIAFPDGDANSEEVYENLLQILSSPYDLNRVSKEELQLLQIMTDAQIESFLSYRKQNGDLVDIHELQAIPGFDITIINKLLPFLKVSDPARRVDSSLFRRMLSDGNSYVVSRYERTLEKRKGFQGISGKTHYEGSADKMYLRFRTAIPGELSAGFTGEKDAGEKILFNPRNNQLVFDFTSAHIQLQNKSWIKNIILGDYQMQFAQGLMLGGAFGLGKGGETIATTRRTNIGFLPYTSINESAYQRGVAASLGISHEITLSFFYSHARRDASTTEGEADSLIVSSFQSSGYHRTQTEVASRKKVPEQNTGIILQIQRNRIEAGLLFNHTKFGVPLRRKPSLYNQYAFTGPMNSNAGVFINYTINNISIFSEAVQTINAGRALVFGALTSLHKNFELSILYRDYARDYHTFYANAFAENTSPQNEKGMYWGWKYGWKRKVSVGGYVDIFSFPWLAFRRYTPSNGYEWLLRISYRPTKKVSLSGQFREESKQRNLGDGSAIYKSGRGIKRNCAITCDYGIGEKLRLKSRIQYNTYQHDLNSTEGLAIAQDVIVSVRWFKVTARHALFDANDYDNRHYIYENDAWLSYSLPAYSGIGVRNYALFEIKVHKNLTIWLRYARTRLMNETEIGSGSDEIEGNIRNDVKFQARYRF